MFKITGSTYQVFCSLLTEQDVVKIWPEEVQVANNSAKSNWCFKYICNKIDNSESIIKSLEKKGVDSNIVTHIFMYFPDGANRNLVDISQILASLYLNNQCNTLWGTGALTQNLNLDIEFYVLLFV